MPAQEHPATLHPITFAEFQRVLNMLGYGMEKHDSSTKLLHWRLDKGNTTLPHNGPLLVTTLMPDFSHPRHHEAVYERDYVMDFLNSIIAGDFDKDGTVIRAILQSEQIH